MNNRVTALGVRTGLLALLVVAAANCGDGSVVEISIPGATDIQLDSLTFSINDGGSYQVEVTVVDSAGNSMDIDPDWETSDPDIVGVTQSGMLTGNHPGVAEITASVGLISRTATVTVLTVPVRLEYVAGSGQEAPAYETLPENLTVRVEDRWGDPVPSVEVDFIVASGGGSVSPATSTTNADGLASTTWTLGDSGEQEIASIARPPSHVASIQDSVVVFSATAEAIAATAPARVENLEVVGTSTESVSLRWTAVSDGMGGVARYAVRLGTPTMSWGSAYDTERTTTGVPVGETITFVYDNLQPGTDYQFQLTTYRGTLNVDAVFGPRSNIVTASTEDVEGGDPVVASVTATPGSHAFDEVGETLQISAVARNATGGIVSGAAFDWITTDGDVAGVNGSGLVTAIGEGTASIVVTSDCCGVADTVNVEVSVSTEPPPPPPLPPPPPGEALYAEDFEDYSVGALMSTGGSNGFRWNSNGGAVTASNGRAHTGSMSMRLRFDHDWAEQRFDIGRLLPEVWIEYWIWIPENYYHSTNGNAYNNKFFFLWDSGSYPGGAAGKVAAMLSLERPTNGNSDMIMMWSSESEMMRTGSAPRWSNAINDAVRGKWSRLRYHVKVASQGASDGVFQFWWDDTLRIDSRNLPLRDNGDNAFQRGYLLGAANAEYSELTDFFIDDFRVYASSPGW